MNVSDVNKQHLFILLKIESVGGYPFLHAWRH